MCAEKNIEIYTPERKIYTNLSTSRINILKAGLLHNFPTWNFYHICNFYWHLYCNPYTTGSGVIFEGKDHPLTENRMLLIPPYTIYTVYSRSPITHFFLHFMISAPALQVKRSPWYIPADLPGIKQMEEIMGEGPESNRISNLAAGMIQRALGLLPEEALYFDNTLLPDPRIDNAIKFYVENEEKKIKNAKVAALVGMSVQNFARLFKFQTGMPPREFHRQRQMQLCGTLLLESGMSIDDIAQKMGYADRFVFSRIFKKYYGMTPGTYRKKKHKI